MKRGIPKDSLLQASVIIDNLRIYHDCGHFQSKVFEDLARSAASALASSAKATKTVGDYSTEYRLNVYVLSPDDLHRIIQEEAMQLGLLRPVQCVPDVNTELLKALEAAASWIEESGELTSRDTIHERITAAIAKAKAVNQ